MMPIACSPDRSVDHGIFMTSRIFTILLPIDGHGQDLSNNLTVAEILITGEIDTSRLIYGSGEQEILTGDVTFLH